MPFFVAARAEFIKFSILSYILLVDAQSEYTLRQMSSDSVPSRQPFLLVGRKKLRPALPELIDEIPQIALKGAEELIVSCAENFATDETESTGRPLSNVPTNTRVDEDTVSATSNPPDTLLAESVQSSIRSTSQMPETADEPEEGKTVVWSVTKAKAKFSAKKELKSPWDLTHLECARPAQVAVRERSSRCLHGGKLYEIGFYVNGDKSIATSAKRAIRGILKANTNTSEKGYEWFKIIGACYDPVKMTPVYTVHTLHGASVSAAARLNLRPNTFDYEYPFQPYGNEDLSPYYSEAEQYRTFEILTGVNIAHTYNDTKSKRLIRTPLASPRNMPLPVWRLVSYSYLNVAPGWEEVVERNWRKVEIALQALAAKEKLNLTIYVGVDRILELHDEAGELRRIYLDVDGERVPVPKFFYTIAYEEISRKAIVFVTLNNPYATESNFLGESGGGSVDICAQSGWGDESWKNVDRGYTTCHEYEPLKNHIPLPEIRVSALLTARSETTPNPTTDSTNPVDQ